MIFRTKILRRLYKNEFLKSAFFNPLSEYHQWRLNSFVRAASSAIAPGRLVIDVGAGESKYRSYFGHCRYVSTDLCVGDSDWDYKGVDVVSSAYSLPLTSESFDAVLCIQVLEHLDAPLDALIEFRRVLKPFGRVYLSVPLLAGEHQQPFDFFRYTRFGLSTLAEKSGFKVVGIEPHGGSVIALDVQLWATFWCLIPFRRQGLIRYVIYFLLYPARIVTGALALLLDNLDRAKSATINYDAVFEKI